MNENEPIDHEHDAHGHGGHGHGGHGHHDGHDEVDDPDSDRRIDYNESLERHRRLGGTDVEACVAAAVSGALFLLDPCDVLWVGLDPDVGFAYENAGARIWDEVCRALIDSAVLCAGRERGLDPDDVLLGHGRADVFGCVPLPVVAGIVDRALTADFSTPDRLDPELAAATDEAFDRIVTEEFGQMATIRLPDHPRGDEVARLVCQRVGSFPFSIER